MGFLLLYMKHYFIYKITNPEGSVYIGKTIDFKRRMRDHKNKTHYEKSPLTASVSEFGWDKHDYEIIDSLYDTEVAADGKEMFWIRTYMSNRNKWPEINGLNLSDGGSGCLGHVGSYKGATRPKEVGHAISSAKFKKVSQYTNNGVFLKQYSSGLEAAKALGVTNKMVSAAALGKRKTCKGYILKYA